MGALVIREKLQEYIKTADDKKVKAIFTMLETDIESYNISPKMCAEDIAEYNKDIEVAMSEIDKGNFSTHEEVVSMIKKRYEKASMV
jgi:GTP-binding protein EngB required for normal cell division